jgi:glycerol-3-phosphate dehydrogenase (NAD+)
LGENVKIHSESFESEIKMWVFEEEVEPPNEPKYRKSLGDQPVKLTHIINTVHENIKYLPGIALPENIVASSSLEDTVKDASILVFNLPHQFMEKTLSQISGHQLPYARGVSCVKGVSVSESRVGLFSELITEKLGIYCGALSGANIATEVAAEKFCETTIGYDTPPMDYKGKDGSPENYVKVNEQRQEHTGPTSVTLVPVPPEYKVVDAELLTLLFQRPYFNVTVVSDVAGVSLAGALKNIVALGVGFAAGRGWGSNAEAAVMRRGLLEMLEFGRTFFPKSVKTETFTEQSAGVADLVASCLGGRNFRCAKLAAERDASVEEIERTELNGQKLQGLTTAEEIFKFLVQEQVQDKFPLFRSIHGIYFRHYSSLS